MTIVDIPLNDDLRDLGVTQFKKQGRKTLLLLCKDKNNKGTAVIFSISKDGPYDTLLNFENAAKDKLQKVAVEAIKVVLLQEDNGYLEFLLYGKLNGDGENNDDGHAIGEQQGDKEEQQQTKQQHQQEGVGEE